MLYTTIIDGVTFYSQEYLEWKERHAWWSGASSSPSFGRRQYTRSSYGWDIDD
jgi:hypothetical protein